MKSGIYVILNTINNKKYVGSTIHFNNRWSRHKYRLNKKCHSNQHLQNAWHKYGSGSFKFEILEYVINTDSLVKTEQYWIDKLRPEYNKRIIAENNKGYKMTDEQKKKRSDKYKKRVVTDEWRRRMSESAYLRDPMSLETKIKMSEAKTGLIPKNLTLIQNSNKKSVLKIKDGNILCEYSSIMEASINNKISRGNIGSCCIGKRKSAGGFNWEFKN